MNKIKDNGISPVIATILLVALSIILVSLVSVSVMSAVGSFTPVENKVVGFTVQVNASNNSALITPVSGTDLPFLLSYRVYTNNGHWDKPNAGNINIPDFTSAVTYVNIVGNFTDGVTALVFSGKVVVEGGVVIVTPIPTPTVTTTPVTPTPTPVPTPSPYYVVGSEPYANASEFVDSLNEWIDGTADLDNNNNNNLLLFRDIIVGNQPIILTSEIMGSDNELLITDGWSSIFHESGKDNITISRAPGYAGALLVIEVGTLSSQTVQIVLDGTNQVGSAPLLRIENGATLSLNEVLTVVNGINEGGEGGGIYNAGTLKVQDKLIVANNKAREGGGIYNKGTSIQINKCDIYNNEASEKGGGIYNALGSTVPMNNGNIKIHDNTAADGGGVYNAGTLTGGFPLTNNNAYGNGGGIYNTGTVTFTSGGLLISGNSATNGGGIYNPGTMTIGGPISLNTAVQRGGGLYNVGKYTMNSGSFTGNTAVIKGNKVYAIGGSTNSISAGILTLLSDGANKYAD